jgi:N-acetylneuraminic acid mutarotase
VYWRHRIWPKENPQPKPALDVLLPLGVLRAKVDDYLRKSEAKGIRRGRPFDPDELRAEMTRIATHTKQPQMLREVGAALGDDPHIIAECLARATLAEGMQAIAVVHDGKSSTAQGTVPDRRYLHTAVWTGSEMLVWGGVGEGGYLNTGWRYDPTTDTWSAISTTDAPAARDNHTAVWTGREMIVWGGFRVHDDFDTGGRYDPATDTWVAIGTTHAPSPRAFHRAVWTGSEMIVWGGYDDVRGVSLDTGGRYNPSTDGWTSTSMTGAPLVRTFHTAIWTGSEMIVWGGFDLGGATSYNTGGRYDPATDTWTPTSISRAPTPRDSHTAVWTGSEMIVWGGYDNTGGRYDPAGDTWTTTDVTNAPSPRNLHTAVWTGSDMIVWGGRYFDGQDRFYNTGGRYDPATDTWAETDAISAPAERYIHTAVWTDSSMIVWGGANDVQGVTFNTGGRYDPGTDGWTATSASPAGYRR